MYKLYYIWLVPAVFCLVYYVCCVAYAGFASSFITIWPVTAVFFAGIFAVRYAQNKGILILPMWINVLSAAGLLILISSFCLVQALITVQMKQKPEPDCEYLLILGCRVRGLEITKSLRYRLDAALAYLEQNDVSGTVILYGCPGEEGGAAKAGAVLPPEREITAARRVPVRQGQCLPHRERQPALPRRCADD